jgi:plastocyanin/cytochrome c5
VRVRAADVAVPDLERAELIEQGFATFDGTCAPCHGAPGVERSPIGQNQTPRPPEIADALATWNAAELFWITRHGIKMTGMPAWGPELADDEIWAIVAFMQVLPGLSPQDYEAMRPEIEVPEPEEVEPAAVVEMLGVDEFTPAEITIGVGDTVLWSNESEFDHTVTADPELAADPDSVILPEGAEPFDSGSVAPGETFEHSFTVPGRYRYFCIPHEGLGMIAEIVVEEAPQ